MTTAGIVEDAWLASLLGRPAFRLDPATPAAGGAVLASAANDHARTQKAAFYFARVATDQVETAHQLTGIGFLVVDVNVTFDREPSSTAAPSAPAPSIVVTEATPDQHPPILAIAGSCFRYSRFHLDPLMPKSLAHRIKREWVSNCLRGVRGEAVLAATLDDRPAGFLTVVASRPEGHEVRTIDLVGVAAEAQGRGVGRALTAAFIDRYAGRCDRLEVGTQAANVPSLRLYETLGFRVARTAYVMHRHVGPPLAA